nr:GDP/GTP exchange factor for ARF [Polyrhizophydium stewartii]
MFRMHAHAQDDIQTAIFSQIDKASKLPSETLNAIADSLIAGLLAVIKTDIGIVSRHPERWETVLHLLSATSGNAAAAPYGFEAACLLVSNHPDSPVTAENFGECVDLLISFVAALDRALRAVDRLYGLQTKIPRLVSATGIHPQRAWFELWLPVLSGLGQLCYHPSREVRQQAQTLLQRSLLSAELDESLGTHPAPSATETRIDAFDNVLFPLLDELLKPEVHAMDPAGIEETRVRAVGLVDKVFLRFLPRLVKSKELLRVWVRVLNYAGAFLTVGGRQRREYVVEGVLESLKNLLLVLSAEGVLRPPGAEPTGAPELNLWDLTWTTIQPFLPSLRDELFPPAAIAAAAAAASRAATQPQPQPPPADAQPAAAAAPQ